MITLIAKLACRKVGTDGRLFTSTQEGYTLPQIAAIMEVICVVSIPFFLMIPA